MIDAKQAAHIAVDYVTDAYADLHIHDVLLEEIEQSEDGRTWLITVGFDRTKKQIILAGTNLTRDTSIRDYKQIHINKTSGGIESMKIRAV